MGQQYIYVGNKGMTKNWLHWLQMTVSINVLVDNNPKIGHLKLSFWYSRGIPVTQQLLSANGM